MEKPEHLDVLIIGAGLSGVGAAAKLAMEHPRRSYAVLEARSVSGGTWDLFRYPGVRSDSDMFTLGYRFKPWNDDRALADGPSILRYVRETATEYGVDRHIRYEHRVTEVHWDSATAMWTVEATVPDGAGGREHLRLTCDFLWCCTGYYDYDQGFTPHFTGQERFAGRIVHPQHWPEDLDYAGKKVVVIGSGATAVTLVPALARPDENGVRAGRVTMLQRSPTYVLSLPARDKLAIALRKRLPERAAYWVNRWRSILVATALYQGSQRFPRQARRLIRKVNQRLLPEGYDVDTHFRPRYDPWDQRLCLVPDADLFKVLGDGSAEMVTGGIETFTENGVRLTDGRELEADIIVTATGLNLKIFGGTRVTVDGAELKPEQTMAYRALMLSDVPNFAFTIGYTNASWTLKADLVAEFVCRLLTHMDERGYRSVTPRRQDDVTEKPLMDFEAGYVLRSLDQLPRAGDREPWMLKQNYLRDVKTIRRAPLDDGVLSFR